MTTRPNGLDSGLAMLEDMLAAGMLTEEERQKAAVAHLQKVYGITPVVYDFPCLTCEAQRGEVEALREVAEAARNVVAQNRGDISRKPFIGILKAALDRLGG